MSKDVYIISKECEKLCPDDLSEHERKLWVNAFIEGWLTCEENNNII